MFLETLFLLFGFIHNDPIVDSGNKNLVKSIQVIKCPNDIRFIDALSTEESFDSFCRERGDTVYPNLNFLPELGQRLKEYSHIDIRTKVVIELKNGEVRKYFMDNTGYIMYKDKIYKGSYEQMILFRCETDSIPPQSPE